MFNIGNIRIIILFFIQFIMIACVIFDFRIILIVVIFGIRLKIRAILALIFKIVLFPVKKFTYIPVL